MKRVVQEQSAFRTSYKKNPSGYVLCEHTPEADFEIPYVDMSNATDPDYKITENCMEDACIRKKNYSLYRLMVVKESKNIYAILLNISHSIWDKKSSMIFVENVKKYLRPKEKTYGKVGKLSYAANLLYGSINSFKKQNNEGLKWLEMFASNKARYLRNEQNNKILRYEITKIPLCGQSRESYNSERWAFILRIVQRIIELNNSQKSVLGKPCSYFVFAGRHFFLFQNKADVYSELSSELISCRYRKVS